MSDALCTFALSFILLFLNVNCRDEAIVERDLSAVVRPREYPGYVPAYLEVRASTCNTKVHGIYRREDALAMTRQRVLWYDDEANRPVFKKIASNDVLYIYWSPVPNPQWRISTQYPVSDPRIFDKAILGSVPSYAYSPVFTKGWFIELSPDDEERQIKGDAKELLISRARAIAPARSSVPNRLAWDDSILIDEARAGAFSLKLGKNREMGCPSDSHGMKGTEGYAVDPCKPPPPSKDDFRGRGLEFTMTGIDGLLRKTLFTWAGYFLRRPYFVLRSPLIAEEPHTSVDINPRIQYLWAEGLAGRVPTWFISRELGNKHPSQLFARWSLGDMARDTYHRHSGADWPAEPGVELISDRWVVFERPIQFSHLIGTEEENPSELKTMIQMKAQLATGKKVTISSPVVELSGDYKLLGEYLGYPYYRQASPGPGYVLYRGFVVSADLDTWVLGCSLGSNEGLKAYANDDNARWPHMIDVSWWIWNTTAKEWRRETNMKIKLGFEIATALPIVEKQVFGQCPLPKCPPASEAICPPTGTCEECLCQPEKAAAQEKKLRQETDETEFLRETISAMPKEQMVGETGQTSEVRLLPESPARAEESPSVVPKNQSPQGVGILVVIWPIIIAAGSGYQ